METKKSWYDVDLTGQCGNEEYRVFGSDESVKNWVNSEKANYGYLSAIVNEVEPSGAEFTTHRKIKAFA